MARWDANNTCATRPLATLHPSPRPTRRRGTELLRNFEGPLTIPQ